VIDFSTGHRSLKYSSDTLLHLPPEFIQRRKKPPNDLLIIIMLFFLPYAIDNFDDEVNRKMGWNNKQ
jgi:hypothetical protein